ncbi:MAG: type II toxin-antitoxin system VapC family toxin [Planctomycetaceae bacterium]
MDAFFLDSSALLKRYLRESGTTWVRAVTAPDAANRLYVSTLCLVEVISAITRRRRAGLIKAKYAAILVARFHRDYRGQYTSMDLVAPLLSDAVRLVETYGLRGYDAVQLASAVDVAESRRRSGFSSITFVSSDRELNVAAAAEGLAVDDPNDHP